MTNQPSRGDYPLRRIDPKWTTTNPAFRRPPYVPWSAYSEKWLPQAEKKRLLMDGLCELIQADCWIWTLLGPVSPGERFGAVGFQHGGFDEARLTAYCQAI